MSHKVTVCHPNIKHYAHGLCRPCYGKTRKSYNKVYREDHKEEQKKKSAEWYKNNTEHVSKKVTRRRLKLAGWTPESVEEAREKQNNCCAICLEPFTKTPNADHKHSEPPVPRGLLCGTCNTALGLFQDDPALLRKASEYVEKY